MSEQDPLRKNRLGLRTMLLVSGGVLVASSVFLLPNVGLVQGTAPTTALPDPPMTSATPGRTAAPSAGASPNGKETGSGSSSAAQPLLPVYWLGGVDGQDRLFREFLRAPTGSVGDPIADAVRLMTSSEPLDPDYHSPWRAASSVSSSISTKNVITLDISSDAFDASLTPDEARLALQQLVHTATAAAASAALIAGGESSSVVVLVDGAAGYRAFDAIDLDGELTRDASTLAPVWIIDPQEGVGSDGSLTIHGLGPASEESLNWRVDRLADSTSEAGTGGTDLFRDGRVDIVPEEGAPGAYSFSVTLPPGQYEISVSVPTDGEAADTKNVLVR
ncbi:GerMN domain-containing protein [Arthrobacter sp. NamB2]|uniref:GerMN domain-containing protein n=1 Tax=Arthrobacter sp. NamB2 TaxID=2576035 RepID=UPI0010C99F22|nr:GerMN domain-containing protein [Arthrobacter sp. NamB2]TKV26868.1 GerMN domain-containing protein [Arthrobacter sp. NamB2]